MGTFDDVTAITKIAVNTHLAGAAGVVTGAVVTRLLDSKTDVVMMLNGALAGLVAITAEPLTPTPGMALVIGSIGSLIMYFGTKFLERMGLDDVVGAIPVHMFAGIFGTLIVPLTNADTSFGSQFTGVIAVCSFSFILSFIIFKTLKATVGLRISKEAEKLGTDVAEIGVRAYAIRD
jgi:Amt family ammonium transporter